MNATGTASIRSILDKPLKQLTEDDISQLTREDCRRFLKEKGMRRPSWNKSQAIQQVICLKALLEPADDDSAATAAAARGTDCTFVSAAQQYTPASAGNLNDAPVSDAAEEPGFHAADELQKSGSSGEKFTGTETNETNVVSPRGCATSESVGQMTIFYCGKVNVYDGVSPDKARAIMQLAASPVNFPQDDPLNRNAAGWASPYHLQMDKDVLVPIDATIVQATQADKMVDYPTQYREKGSIARDTDVEGQASRKVSLQRYLEKRKDRGRLKSKKLTGITSSSSTLEMYLNLPVKAHASNGNSSRSSTSSPPQPRLPLASSGSADNQLKIALPIDLNHKDVQGC